MREVHNISSLLISDQLLNRTSHSTPDRSVLVTNAMRQKILQNSAHGPRCAQDIKTALRVSMTTRNYAAVFFPTSVIFSVIANVDSWIVFDVTQRDT